MFARNGIILELEPSASAVENLARLMDPDGGVDAVVRRFNRSGDATVLLPSDYLEVVAIRY